MKVLKTKPFKDRLLGHKNTIVALNSPYGPNSSLLYSASKEGTIRGRKINNKLVLSRNSKETKEANIQSNVNLETKEEEIKNLSANDFILSGEFSENIFFSGYNDGTIIGWSLKEGEVLYNFTEQKGKINFIKMINNRVLASGSSNGSLFTWDLSNGTIENQMELGGAIQFMDSKENKIFVLVERNKFFVIDSITNNINLFFDFSTDFITSFVVSSVNEIIFGTMGKDIQKRLAGLIFINSDDFENVKAFVGIDFPWIHFMSIYQNYLICGCDDSFIRVYSKISLQLLLKLKGHEDGVNILAIADTMIYSASFDHTIKSWDIEEISMRLQEMQLMFQEDVLSRKFYIFSAATKKKGKKKKKSKKKKKAIKTEDNTIPKKLKTKKK